MLTFAYKARNTSNNKVEKNTIQAATAGAAYRLLMAQGLVPIGDLEVVDENAGLMGFMRNHVSSKDVVIFTRQLATMLDAGLPLAQSLATVQEQTSNRALKSIVADLAANINGGQPLSDSLAKYPKVFNNVYVALVRAGETSGTLDQSLMRLANQQEHDADQLSKIRGAMVYPAIVLAVIIAVVIFMLVTLIPEVANMYEDLGRTLPPTTQFLLSVVNFFGKFWYIIIAVLGAGIFFLRRWIATTDGRKAWDTLKLNLPLVKGLLRKLYMARFSRTSEVLLRSGVSMMETLRISADAVNNVVIKEELTHAIGKVKNGKALSEALSDQDYILKFVPQMIKIGETSGGIDAMLGKVADYYDKEVDNAIATISTLIEPVLMILMAFLIGFIVLAVLVPIYSLSNVTTL